MKSASLKTEALKKSKAEIVEESHSMRQLSSSAQRLSNSELGCCRMFEVPLHLQLEIENTLPRFKAEGVV
jgi:hypothetical protein